MITNPKVLEYLDIISPVNSKAIEEIRAEAKRNYIPIIKKRYREFFEIRIEDAKSGFYFGNRLCCRLFRCGYA